MMMVQVLIRLVRPPMALFEEASEAIPQECGYQR
jgi:hypothetical protein